MSTAHRREHRGAVPPPPLPGRGAAEPGLRPVAVALAFAGLLLAMLGVLFPLPGALDDGPRQQAGAPVPEPAAPAPVPAVDPAAKGQAEEQLGRVLRRPTIIPMPAFAARLAFGEMAEALLLASTRVVPKRLQESGYRFLHPDIDTALRHTLNP